MANQMYGKGRQKFLDGSISWSSDTIKAILVNTASYTISINTDEFQHDIPSGMQVAVSSALASKTSTLGTADAADITFTSVAGTVTCSLIVLFKDTGTDTTSPLICAFDTGTGLPVTTNGGDITVQWDNGSNKIFTLFESMRDKDPHLLGVIKNLIKALRIPHRISDSGLWLPAPKVVQGPPSLVGAV